MASSQDNFKQRIRPLRGFTPPASADILARGHAPGTLRVQNLHNDFSALAARILRSLRLAVAWSHLARAI